MSEENFPVIDLSATGANIVRLRQERGLTVRDLQSYFGFEQPQAIYKWQSGKNLPSTDNLCALSSLFKVPIETILVLQEDPTHPPVVTEPLAGANGSAFLRCLGYGKVSGNRTPILPGRFA